MLDYERRMFEEIYEEDGLLISARGLGADAVFTKIVRKYCDPENLVIILGTHERDKNFVLSALKDRGISTLPKMINSECSPAQRESIYLKGGAFFVSSRIMVVDLLKRRIPVEKITGFVVYRAHTILESHQDAFALRLYRYENKIGFVKAFSSCPESFTGGFSKIERIMKTLFVRNLYLWPRFHALVNATFEKSIYRPEVIELRLNMTTAMLDIQVALLDLINYAIREIKRLNPSLDADDITVENALTKSFKKLLENRLDPIWHQLSSSTKQLVEELNTFKRALAMLTEADCVRFYKMLMPMRSPEYASKCSGWVLMDMAEVLFSTAKRRLYNNEQKVMPEVSPKWDAILETIKEIKSDSEGNDTIVIFASSHLVCKHLNNILLKGSQTILLDFHEKLIKSDSWSEDVNESRERWALTYTMNAESGKAVFAVANEESSVPPSLVIQPFKAFDNSGFIAQSLQKYDPKFIIMYDTDVGPIRQIEAFQAGRLYRKLTAYFLIYGGSVEEQTYLATLRREKAAFEFLINEKTVMCVPEYQDGKSDNCPHLARNMVAKACLNEEGRASRTGGGENTDKLPVVIADMREFRSELPVLIHRSGMDVEPVTLTVGDYVLTPDICVERKSINDLIGSLQSGRLYKQAVAMCRHYTKAVLLIEFDPNKSFNLEGRYYYLSKDISSEDVTSKLQLLTLHVPQLKIVWSPSPFATAQLFQELKEGKAEPDALVAVSAGASSSTPEQIQAPEFLKNFPGLNTRNAAEIVRNFKNFQELLAASSEKLKNVLKSDNDANLLHSALHKSYNSSIRENDPLPLTMKGAKAKLKRSTPGFRVLNSKK